MNKYIMREGRFTIPEELMNRYPEALMELVFSKMIIARAEFLVVKREFEYYAWSNEFDRLEVGDKTPTYIVEITRDEGGFPISSNFVRQ